MAQVGKEGGVFPDGAERLLADVAGIQRQIPARKHLTPVADERDTRPCQAALRHGIHCRWMPLRVTILTCVPLAVQALWALTEDAAPSFLRLPLAYDTEVMGGACCFQFDAALHFRVVHPVKDLFVLRWRDLLVVGDLHAAADRNQQKEVQGGCFQLAGEGEGCRHLSDIVPRYRCVDLVGNAHRLQMRHAGQRAVKRARAAENVVRGRVRAVKTDADAANARLPDVVGHIRVNERAVRRQGDNQPPVAGITRNLKNIGPEQRFAAR